MGHGLLKRAFAAVALFAATLTAQTPQLMDDPLFAIRYDPQKTGFEKLPASLIDQCPELRGRYTAAWVYAHVKSTDSEYFIVSGLMNDADEETGMRTSSVHPDETGLIVALRGSFCGMKAQDSFYWINDAPIWNLSEATVNELALDALRRYANAFEGNKNLWERIPKNTRQSLAPALRTQVEKLQREQER